MTREELAAPNNPAELKISGNRLVSICNTVQAAMYRAGNAVMENDKLTFESPYYADLYAAVEAIRDELSAQRMAREAPAVANHTEKEAFKAMWPLLASLP